MSFGVIPQEHWVQPEWIDEEHAKAERKKMASHVLHLIPYGGQYHYL